MKSFKKFVSEAKDTHCSDKCCGADVKAEDCTCPADCPHCDCNSVSESVEQVDENWATKAMDGKSPLKKKYQAPKDGEPDRAQRMKKKMYGSMMGGLKNEEVELDEVLDTPKAWNSYMRKNKTSFNKAGNERLFGKDTPKRDARTLKTLQKRSKGREMADRLRDRHWNKAIGHGYVNKSTDESFDLDESQINDITAQYINENNISMEELENMTEQELNELIGKAIGGAFKLGAKAVVGTARLGAKAAVGTGRLAKRAVVNKQGSIRGTKAARDDKAGDRAEKKAKAAERERARRDRIKAAQDRVKDAQADLQDKKNNNK